MRRSLYHITYLLVAMILLGAGCSSPSDPGEPPAPKSPPMGFALYPTMAMSSNPDRYLANFSQRADMLAIQWDGGIPWEMITRCPDLDDCREFEDSTLARKLEAMRSLIAGLKAQADTFHRRGRKVYLAISPLNKARDGVALTYPDNIPTPISSNFSRAQLRFLYSRFCFYLISKLQPDYFSPAVDFNMYVEKNSGDFSNLVLMLSEIKNTVGNSFPAMRIAPTIQWEHYRRDYQQGKQSTKDTLMKMLNSWSTIGDFHPISTYPHLLGGSGVPDSAYYAFNAMGLTISDSRPLMIAESGAPAEMQSGFLQRLFTLPKQYKTLGLIWFFLEDLDAQPLPAEYRNMGLYNDANPGTLAPNPGLAAWESFFIHR